MPPKNNLPLGTFIVCDPHQIHTGELSFTPPNAIPITSYGLSIQLSFHCYWRIMFGT